MAHPADETRRSIFLHGWLSALLAATVLVVSIVADLLKPGMHWTQRAGSIITVLGAYVAYVDAKRSFKFINGHFYLNFELPYRVIAIVLVVIGTVTWGYGDLLL